MVKNFSKNNSDLPAIKIVIFEDNKREQTGLETELNAQPDMEIVGASADPNEFINFVRDTQAHVAIIDLRIYDDEKVGINVLKDIKKDYSSTKCLVLTNLDDLKNFILCIDAGAECFARKAHRPGQQPDLPELVRIVASGGRFYVSDLILEMRKYIDVTKMMDSERHDAHEKNPLTLQEQRVLTLAGDQLSDSEIAKKLVISENTVTAHLSHIYDKLNIHDRYRAYQYAIVNGWLGANNTTTT